jgi:hypothetical protein
MPHLLIKQVMPLGFELPAIESASEVPELDSNGWFWLAVSESVHGQAIMALVRPVGGGAQDAVAALSLRRAALDSYVVATRFAGFVRKVRPGLASWGSWHGQVWSGGGLAARG